MKTTQPFISNPNGQIQGKVDLWSGRGYQTYAPPPRGSQRRSSSPPATSPSRPPWCDPTRTRTVGPPWIPWSSVSCPACSAAAPLVSQWTPDWGWRRWLYWQWPHLLLSVTLPVLLLLLLQLLVATRESVGGFEGFVSVCRSRLFDVFPNPQRESRPFHLDRKQSNSLRC